MIINYFYFVGYFFLLVSMETCSSVVGFTFEVTVQFCGKLSTIFCTVHANTTGWFSSIVALFDIYVCNQSFEISLYSYENNYTRKFVKSFYFLPLLAFLGVLSLAKLEVNECHLTLTFH